MLVFLTLYTYLLKMAPLPHQRQMKVISHSGKVYFNMYMYPSIQHMTIVTLHQFFALIVPSATSYCCYSKDSQYVKRFNTFDAVLQLSRFFGLLLTTKPKYVLRFFRAPRKGRPKCQPHISSSVFFCQHLHSK